MVRALAIALCAAAALTGSAGAAHAQDRAKARTEIKLYKADISKADDEISSRNGRILAGEVLIVAAEVAVSEAKKKPDNDAAVVVLELSLAALKAKKNDLVREKQEWERFRRDSQTELAKWEAYLRKLGG